MINELLLVDFVCWKQGAVIYDVTHKNTFVNESFTFIDKTVTLFQYCQLSETRNQLEKGTCSKYLKKQTNK